MKTLVFGALSVLLALSTQAASAANLTPTAITQGFTLSTYESGYASTGGVGPVGVAVFNGNVYTTDYPQGFINIKPDVDGQVYTAAGTNYGSQMTGLTVLNGNIYGANQITGIVSQINLDGTLNHNFPIPYPSATGIAGNSISNHLYLSITAGGGIREIDLAGNTVAQFGQANGTADGLTVKSDNSIIYAAQNGHIYGYNTVTFAQVFDSGAIAGGPDGLTLGKASLLGNLFVNTNGGQLIEINLNTLAQTVLVTNGTRGDFVTSDGNSMLFTQTDSVLRLTAPAGGGFDSNATPLPSAASMGALSMLLVTAGLAVAKRRHARLAPTR